jgi:hypothetical protein
VAGGDEPVEVGVFDVVVVEDEKITDAEMNKAGAGVRSGAPGTDDRYPQPSEGVGASVTEEGRLTVETAAPVRRSGVEQLEVVAEDSDGAEGVVP